MPEDLIPYKVVGIFNEEKHHAIAAKLKVMSDEWDAIEEKTGIRPPEAYSYSFGLVMGKKLIFATLGKDKDILGQKIATEVAIWR